MAIEEEINWKINLDTSSLEQQAQRASMIAQQQAAAQTAAVQSNMAIMNSSPYIGEMSGRGLYAQQAYSQAVNNNYGGVPSSQGFYALPSMSPNSEVTSNYRYPYGLLDGPYQDRHQERTLSQIIATQVGDRARHVARGIGRSGFGQALGLQEWGMYDAGDYTKPLYRSQQLAADRIARGQENFRTAAIDYTVGTVGAAAGIYDTLGLANSVGLWGAKYINPNITSFGGFSKFTGAFGAAGLPISLGIMAGDYAYGKVAEARDTYKDIGGYFRDAMAPNFKDYMGGGASHKRAANFVEGLGKMVGEDKYFKRDQYTDLTKFGIEEGLFQTYNDEQKVLKGIDNVAKGIKAFNAIAVQLNDAKTYVKQMSNLGLNVADMPQQAAQFIGTLGLNATAGGITKNDLMNRAAEAGEMFSHVKVDGATGSQIYMNMAGLAGSLVSSGAIKYKNLQHLGGKEGITQHLAKGLATLQGSPMGSFTTMAMLRDPSLQERVLGGQATSEDVQRSMRGLSAREYYDLAYKQSNMTSEMDQTALTLGDLEVTLNRYKKQYGRNPTEGEIYALLQQERGLSSSEAKSMIALIQNAPAVTKQMRAATNAEAAKIRVEANRRAPSIVTAAGDWWDNLTEGWADPLGAKWASHSLNRESGKYDQMIKELMPNAVITSADLGTSETAAAQVNYRASNVDRYRTLEETTLKSMKTAKLKDYQAARQKGGWLGGVNEVVENLYDSVDGKAGVKRNMTGHYDVSTVRSISDDDVMQGGAFLESYSNEIGDVLSGYKNKTSKRDPNVTKRLNDLSLEERKSYATQLAQDAKNSDMQNYFLRAANITLGFKEGDKGYMTEFSQFKNLTSEQRENIGLTGLELSKYTNSTNQSYVKTLMDNTGKAVPKQSYSLDELKKFGIASSNGEALFNAKMADTLGKRSNPYAIKTAEEIDLVNNTYKESRLTQLSTADGTALDTSMKSEAATLLTSKELEELNNISDPSAKRKRYRELIQNHKNEVSESIKNTRKLGTGYEDLYGKVSADFSNVSYKPELIKAGETYRKAKAQEVMAYGEVKDSSISTIEKLMGSGGTDLDAMKQISGALVDIKQKGAKGEAAVDTIWRNFRKGGHLKNYGEAGTEVMRLLGSNKTGAELEKTKEYIASLMSGYGDYDKANMSRIIDDIAAGKGIRSKQEAAQAFINGSNQTMMASTNVFDKNGAALGDTMLTKDQRAGITQAYQNSENLIKVLNSLSNTIDNVGKMGLNDDKSVGVKVLKEISAKLDLNPLGIKR